MNDSIKPTGERDSGREWLWLLVCLLVAVAARLLDLSVFATYEARGDEAYYLRTARTIAQLGAHPGSYRPPLWPFTLAAMIELLGPGRFWLRVGQVFISLIPVVVVFRLAATRFGGRAPLIAGLACALTPHLVHFGHLLWAENLVTALLMLCFWALEVFDRSERRGQLALAAVLLGLTSLARESWVFFGAVIVVWLAWRRQWNLCALLPEAGVFVAGMAITILPWTVRNWQLHDSFVLVSTCRWFPIASGNLQPEGHWYFDRINAGPYKKDEPRKASELEVEEYWRGVALEQIRAQQPLWILRKLVRNTSLLFSLQGQTARYIGFGWWEDPDPRLAIPLILYDVICQALLLTLGLFALWVVPTGRIGALLVAALLYTIALHTIANAVTRFLVPLMPMFALYVGGFLSGARSTNETSWSRLRPVGAALTVAVFLGLTLTRLAADVGPAWSRVLGD